MDAAIAVPSAVSRWRTKHKKVGLLRRINNASVYNTILRAYNDCKPRTPVLLAPCSYGWFFDKFRADGIEVVGIDIEHDRIEAARNVVTPPMKVMQGSILEMPFEDSQFDFTVANRFILHFNDEFKAKAMKELARVTKKHVLVHYDYYKSFRQWGRMLRGVQPDVKNFAESSSYRVWKRNGRKQRYNEEMMAAEGAPAGLKVKKLYFMSYLLSERVYCLYEKA